jgi:hypothetical protein
LTLNYKVLDQKRKRRNLPLLPRKNYEPPDENRRSPASNNPFE